MIQFYFLIIKPFYPMKIAKLQSGEVVQVLKQYEAQTEIKNFDTQQKATISNDDIVEIVKIALTVWDIIKLLISKFKGTFKKS
jgi:hypothetical protein